MYDIDDLIQLSSLQHFAFCPRQCDEIFSREMRNEKTND